MCAESTQKSSSSSNAKCQTSDYDQGGNADCASSKNSVRITTFLQSGCTEKTKTNIGFRIKSRFFSYQFRLESTIMVGSELFASILFKIQKLQVFSALVADLLKEGLKRVLALIKLSLISAFLISVGGFLLTEEFKIDLIRLL